MSEKDLKSKVSPTPTEIDVDRTPVAQDIWCYSTKEKAMTWHVVVNHDAKGYVDRVMCKTSKTTHKYKKQNKVVAPAAENKTTLTRRASPKAAERSANLEEIWFEGVKAWGNKVVPNYSPQNHYSAKEVLEHPNFGKGVVQGRRENRIDILFRTGMKTLMSVDSRGA